MLLFVVTGSFRFCGLMTAMKDAGDILGRQSGWKPPVGSHAYNPRTWKTEAGGLPRVEGQPER